MQTPCMNQSADAGVLATLPALLELLIASPHKFEKVCGLKAKSILSVARRRLYALRSESEGREVFVDVQLPTGKRPACIVWGSSDPKGYVSRHRLYTRRLH